MRRDVPLGATMPDHRSNCASGNPLSAIEELFAVKVTGVWTSNHRGKDRRVGQIKGRRPHWKKAIVTLASGDSIDIFEA